MFHSCLVRSVIPRLHITTDAVGFGSTCGGTLLHVSVEMIGFVVVGTFFRARAILSVPVVDGILVPIIDLLLQRRDPGFLRTETAGPVMSVVASAGAQAQLDVVFDAAVCQCAKAGFATSLQHAAMIPAAEANGAQAAHHIGDDVERVEGPVVREETLHDLGADAQKERADQQSELQGSSTGRIGDPVEDEGEEEEGDEVQELVIGLQLRGYRAGGAVREEAHVGREEEKEHECACRERDQERNSQICNVHAHRGRSNVVP